MPIARPNFLFSDDLQASSLAARLMAVGQKQLSNSGHPQTVPPTNSTVFGMPLAIPPCFTTSRKNEQARKVTEGTLGEFFDERAEIYKALSDDQQRLSSHRLGRRPKAGPRSCWQRQDYRAGEQSGSTIPPAVPATGSEFLRTRAEAQNPSRLQ